MSKKSEKTLKQFESYIQNNNSFDISDKETLNNAMQAFMSENGFNEDDIDDTEDAYYFLELADSADTKKDALKYAKKAIEIEPDNLDALSMVINLSCNSIEKMTDKYKKLIEQAEVKLNEQGYFDDDSIGDFWLISETRSYMRLLHNYAYNLVQSSQMRLAIEQYEKMLKLCYNDNLGVRYVLMHLYAYLEDEQSALDLNKRYPDEGTQFLLPLSVLYYKLGDLRKSSHYLTKLSDVNKDTYLFFDSLVNDSLKDLAANMNSYGYSPFTFEEFLVECEEDYFLFSSVPSYFVWAKKKLNSKRKKK